MVPRPSQQISGSQKRPRVESAEPQEATPPAGQGAACHQLDGADQIEVVAPQDQPPAFKFCFQEEEGADGRATVAESASRQSQPSPTAFSEPARRVHTPARAVQPNDAPCGEVVVRGASGAALTLLTTEATDQGWRRCATSAFPRTARRSYVSRLAWSKVTGASYVSPATAGGCTDLVPGVYEGGLKVWECSLDLAGYMLDNGWEAALAKKPTSAPPLNETQHVLELGCGHGLPGIVALRAGAHVAFSDYNVEVLQHVTAQNVQLNVWDLARGDAAYYSGDWLSLDGLWRQEGGPVAFDVILSAETLYTTGIAEKVYEMILRHLRRPDGRALVAAKRYYFGTGGSTAHFRNLVDRGGILHCRVAAVFDTGLANIREIMEITWASTT